MDLSDNTLVAQACEGDREAFSTLVLRHYDLIHRLAFRLLGNDADDLTQDVCASLPRKLQSFRGDAKFTTWLHRLVINAGRDALRRRQTHDRAVEGWGDLQLLNQASGEVSKQELAWLQDAMSSLSPDLRETVALVLGEDMTHAAAATILGISEGTVSWRMSAVRKALKDRARAEEILR